MSENKASEGFAPMKEKIIAAQPGWEADNMIPIIAWLIGIDGRVYPITVHGVIRDRPVLVRTPWGGSLMIGETEVQE